MDAQERTLDDPVMTNVRCPNCNISISKRKSEYKDDGFHTLSCVCPECNTKVVISIHHSHNKIDPVNHPPHYNSSPSEIECIQITRHMSFNLGNAIKYIWRAGEKDPKTKIQDLEKARWYLDDEIKRLKETKS